MVAPDWRNSQVKNNNSEERNIIIEFLFQISQNQDCYADTDTLM